MLLSVGIYSFYRMEQVARGFEYFGSDKTKDSACLQWLLWQWKEATNNGSDIIRPGVHPKDVIDTTRPGFYFLFSPASRSVFVSLVIYYSLYTFVHV